MSKIIIESKIENEEEIKTYNTKGILKDNSFIFNEDDYKVNLSLLDEEVSLKRENDNFKYELIFKKNKKVEGSYHIKSLNAYIDIKVKTTNIIIDNNTINIYYELFMNEEKTGSFIYFMKWSEIDEFKIKD